MRVRVYIAELLSLSATYYLHRRCTAVRPHKAVTTYWEWWHCIVLTVRVVYCFSSLLHSLFALCARMRCFIRRIARAARTYVRTYNIIYVIWLSEVKGISARRLRKWEGEYWLCCCWSSHQDRAELHVLYRGCKPAEETMTSHQLVHTNKDH